MAAGFLVLEREAIFGRTVERVLGRFAPVIRERTYEGARRAIDVRAKWNGLVLDAFLPRGDGIDLLEHARARECEAPAIVLGATYVPNAAERAFEHRAFFVIELSELGLERWARHAIRAAQPEPSYDSTLNAWTERYGLSATEREILREAAQGAVHKDIADKRRITANTLKRHVRNLLDKTGDETLSGAALRLLRDALASDAAWPTAPLAGCSSELRIRVTKRDAG